MGTNRLPVRAAQGGRSSFRGPGSGPVDANYRRELQSPPVMLLVGAEPTDRRLGAGCPGMGSALRRMQIGWFGAGGMAGAGVCVGGCLQAAEEAGQLLL